jgi:hypothetical protein
MGDTAVKTEAEAEDYVKFASAEVILDQGATAAQVAETLGVPVKDVEAWVAEVTAARGGSLPEPRPLSRRPASSRPSSLPPVVERKEGEPAKSKGYLQLLKKEQAAALLPPRDADLSRRLAEARAPVPLSQPRTGRTNALEQATPSVFARAVAAASPGTSPMTAAPGGPFSSRAERDYESAVARGARLQGPVSERAPESFQRARELAGGPQVGSPVTERSPVAVPANVTLSPAKVARVEELLQEELVRLPSRRAPPNPPPVRAPSPTPPQAPIGSVRAANITGRTPYLRGRQRCSANLAREAVARNRGNKSAAARELGLSREALYAALGESPYYIARRIAGRA